MDRRERPLLLLTGVAEGLGAATAAAFAQAGHNVVGVARSERSAKTVETAVREHGGRYVHLACDITREDGLADALTPYAASVEVFIHNAHSLLIRPFERTAPGEFEAVWRTACLGAMLGARAVLPSMAARGSGTVILTGATASIRGGANFTAFASAKFALRGLAQSLAREYGPKGVHVAHVLLDGLIDEPQTAQRFGAAETGRMNPAAIARTCLDLAGQGRSAWTHELDLRPFSERF